MMGGSRKPRHHAKPATRLDPTRPVATLTKAKDRPRGPVFAASAIARNRLQLLVGQRCGLVDGTLGRLLGITDRLLAVALCFLYGAFALQAIRADGFADVLLGLADSFVGGAFDFVCRTTHGTILCNVGSGRQWPDLR